MARIESLSILLEKEGKDFLAELYGKVIQNVQKALVSASMKNTDLSGEPASGSVEAKRFANASPKEYGTARAAAAGQKVKAKPVVVRIDNDKEIVEEIEDKDTKLYGVDGLLEKRSANHVIQMASHLDREFFDCACDNAVEVEIDESLPIEEQLEIIIQACENTKNDYVDGVPRDLMRMTCSTEIYGKIRNMLDKQSRANVDTGTEEFYTWHGVETKSCVNLPAGEKILLMVTGAVAQPVMANVYKAEKIPMSEAYAVELFFHYGTEAVTPDLIFKSKAKAVAPPKEDPPSGP